MNTRMEYPTALLYGPTKIGKSSAVIQALGQHAFWIVTERGALAPAFSPRINPSGKIPDHVECLDVNRPVEEVMAALRHGLQMVKQGRYGAIVIDTLSSLADREMARILTIDKIPMMYGKANAALYGRIQRMVWEAMDADCILVAIAHEREPTTIEGKFTPGGPKLPGKLVEATPSLFRMVLRCARAMDAQGGPCRTFRCNPLDAQWITGDSYDVVEDNQPMDLKKALRDARQSVRARLAAMALVGPNGGSAQVQP